MHTTTTLTPHHQPPPVIGSALTLIRSQISAWPSSPAVQMWQDECGAHDTAFTHPVWPLRVATVRAGILQNAEARQGGSSYNLAQPTKHTQPATHRTSKMIVPGLSIMTHAMKFVSCRLYCNRSSGVKPGLSYMIVECLRCLRRAIVSPHSSKPHPPTSLHAPEVKQADRAIGTNGGKLVFAFGNKRNVMDGLVVCDELRLGNRSLLAAPTPQQCTQVVSRLLLLPLLLLLLLLRPPTQTTQRHNVCTHLDVPDCASCVNAGGANQVGVHAVPVKRRQRGTVVA